MTKKVFLLLINVVLLLAANDTTTCHALSHTYGKIISRKSDGQYISYSIDDLDEDGLDRPIKKHGQKKGLFGPSSALLRVRSALRTTFLPSLPSGQGEDSNGNYHLDTLRSSGYISYILYDNIQDLSTSLRSVLATQRILEGVGVGRAGATALSATLNFLIRDGCGMAASLLFTSYASRGFRRDVKRWKFFADIMVDFGITLEILAPSVLSNPLLCGWFLPLLCLGNVCKALCGVAAGACGGALQMHWAMKILSTEEGISEVA
ncbi:hypothetical protein ACHAXA_004671 [Cyclostephanos tholiformis]|uniref:Protein root UVB sensitive/RUS domain-containing protein n=1 Tax=Cyclostephanos tholiformis TaxID=382380 RepID=A0ABD3R491_9STRA